jgi:hypothetical protein
VQFRISRRVDNLDGSSVLLCTVIDELFYRSRQSITSTVSVRPQACNQTIGPWNFACSEKRETRRNPDLVVERTDYVPLEMPPFAKVTNRVEVVFEGADPKAADEATV